MVGLTAGGTAAFYTFTTYMQTFVKLSVGLTDDQTTFVIFGSLVFATLLQPIYGALSDRIGRKPLLIFFGVAGTLATIPILTTLKETKSPLTAFLLICAAWIFVAGYTSINAIVKAELFPTNVRALGVGLPYAITVSVFGGTAPAVALYFKSLGHEDWFYYYLSGMIFLSLIIYSTMRDTKHEFGDASARVASIVANDNGMRDDRRATNSQNPSSPAPSSAGRAKAASSPETNRPHPRARAALRGEIAAPFLRGPDICEINSIIYLSGTPRRSSPHGRENNSPSCTSSVAPVAWTPGSFRRRQHMCTNRGIAGDLSAEVNRLDEREIGRVRSTVERVIQNEQVARFGITCPHGTTDSGIAPRCTGTDQEKYPSERLVGIAVRHGLIRQWTTPLMGNRLIRTRPSPSRYL